MPELTTGGGPRRRAARRRLAAILAGVRHDVTIPSDAIWPNALLQHCVAHPGGFRPAILATFFREALLLEGSDAAAAGYLQAIVTHAQADTGEARDTAIRLVQWMQECTATLASLSRAAHAVVNTIMTLAATEYTSGDAARNPRGWLAAAVVASPAAGLAERITADGLALEDLARTAAAGVGGRAWRSSVLHGAHEGPALNAVVATAPLAVVVQACGAFVASPAARTACAVRLVASRAEVLAPKGDGVWGVASKGRVWLSRARTLLAGLDNSGKRGRRVRIRFYG